MNKIKENFLQKYGVWEYVLFLFGGVLLGRSGWEVIFANFEDTGWEYWVLVIVLAAIGAVFMAAPMTILDFGRKRLPGMTPKSDK